MEKKYSDDQQPRQCGGKLQFRQEIHNGNDAYECDTCGAILVVKMLQSEICTKPLPYEEKTKDKAPANDRAGTW